jgi:adenosine deaminase
VEEVRAAYEFDDLQPFPDIYCQAAEVLQPADDVSEVFE